MVIVDIDGLDVVFPYISLYPEQRDYMHKLKQALDCKGKAVLEMPSGTGKTITLLSLITAHIAKRNDSYARKFVYCTRTVEEMQKVMAEARLLLAAWAREKGSECGMLAVGLASRRHLCIHERVSRQEGEAVDSGCRALTASWVRDAGGAVETSSGVELCDYFENFDLQGEDAILQPGVYDLDDLKEYGRKRGWCPYFLARHMIGLANIVVYSYHYLLDAKVAGIISQSLPSDAVIVFDECHNCDNVACESLSVDIPERMLTSASQNVSALSSSVVFRRREQHTRLANEYARLTAGIPLTTILSIEQGNSSGGEDLLQTPVLPPDIIQEAVPNEIRKAEEFVSLLRRLIDHLKQRMSSNNVLQERPGPFLRQMMRACLVDDTRIFRMLYDRLLLLMRTLQVTDWHEFRPIQRVADFVTLLGTYESEGFVVLFEPFDDVTGDRAPVLRLVNVDAGLAFRWIMDRFDTVVMTSGTLSPLEMYPRMLNFKAAVSASFHMSMDRNCVLPLVLCRGADQLPLSSRFDDRENTAIPRNYGHALLEFAGCVPDGIVVFFVSYVFLHQVLSYWTNDSDILLELERKKLVFVETQEPIEASLAIQNYRTACDSGRGAVLLSVARGRAAEGIDFDGHYGRAVILFGVPFQYTESRTLKAKLSWLAEHHQIEEDDFLIFDAMRQAAQCAGRVIRNKNDYGIVVFADRRFMKLRLRSKLPKWVAQFLLTNHLDLDVNGSTALAQKFLLSMAQRH